MTAKPLRPVLTGEPADSVLLVGDRVIISDLTVNGSLAELVRSVQDAGQEPEAAVRSALEIGAAVMLHGAAKGTVDAVSAEVGKLLALLTEKSSHIEALSLMHQQVSSAKGLGFERRIGAELDACYAPHGDELEATGATPGIASDKTGDYVVTLNPRDTGGRDRRIVFEMKTRRARVTVANALAELDRAMLNRGAQVAVMVFSSQAGSPLRGSPLRVYHGNRVLLVWDEEEAGSDIALAVTAQLARTLAIAAERDDMTLDRQLLAERLEQLMNVIERGSAIRRGIESARRGLKAADAAYEVMVEEGLAVVLELQDRVAAD